jgi:uncharacterized protein (TIGR02596 family)
MKHSNPDAAGRHFIRNTAFTLVEVLVVVTIMSLLMAIVAFTVPDSIASQKLLAASRQVAGDLDHAALVAQRDNRPVEVRFYRFKEADGLGNKQIRAYQFGSITGWDSNGVPTVTFTSEPQHLPTGIVVMSDPNYSTLVTQSPKTPLKTDPQIAADYDYFSYQIRPDGVTTLPKDTKAVLTLVRETQGGTPTKLPTDFRSVVINPTNSKVTSY